jgi:hypothetical protein
VAPDVASERLASNGDPHLTLLFVVLLGHEKNVALSVGAHLSSAFDRTPPCARRSSYQLRKDLREMTLVGEAAC